MLDAEGVEYRIRRHAADALTAEEAARQRGVRLSQIVKTMLTRTPDGMHVVALVPGHRRLDLKRLSAAVGSGNLKLAGRDEVLVATGFAPGSVSPIGLSPELAVIADPSLLAEEWVDISAGRPDAGVELRSSDLLRLAVTSLAVICKDDEAHPLP
jgi:Cys-tRNA(Pro) deacylase